MYFVNKSMPGKGVFNKTKFEKIIDYELIISYSDLFQTDSGNIL